MAGEKEDLGSLQMNVDRRESSGRFILAILAHHISTDLASFFISSFNSLLDH